jgi:hypothetical protein
VLRPGPTVEPHALWNSDRSFSQPGLRFLQKGASTETHVVPDLEFLYGHACEMREPSQDERRCRVGRVTLVSIRLQRRKR